MKKIISLILCIITILSFSIVSFAEEDDFVISYSNPSTYEIVIPPAGSIDSDLGTGEIVVNVVNVQTKSNTSVNVTISSEDYDNGWYLVSTEDKQEKIPYYVGSYKGGKDVKNGDSIILTQENVSRTLYITLEDEKSGDYGSWLTFTSELSTLDAPGIYTAGNVLLATWDELEAAGMDVEKDWKGIEHYVEDYDPSYPVNVLKQYQGVSKIVLDNSVTVIGQNAFLEFQLDEIVIPGNVTEIRDFAFMGCDIKRLTISEGVQIIKDSAFISAISDDADMKIILPSSVQVETWAFAHNSGIASLVVKNTEDWLPYQAFYNCPNLEYVYFAGDEDDWEDIVEDSDYWEENDIGENTQAGKPIIIYNYE